MVRSVRGLKYLLLRCAVVCSCAVLAPVVLSGCLSASSRVVTGCERVETANGGTCRNMELYEAFGWKGLRPHDGSKVKGSREPTYMRLRT